MTVKGGRLPDVLLLLLTQFQKFMIDREILTRNMETVRLQNDVMSTFEPVLFEGLLLLIRCSHIRKILTEYLVPRYITVAKSKPLGKHFLTFRTIYRG
jgi:hypothetical protein